jgi:hypothetical protein
MSQSNGIHTLASCPRYSPDYMAQGDCRNCGHTEGAHQRFGDHPEDFDASQGVAPGAQTALDLR